MPVALEELQAQLAAAVGADAAALSALPDAGLPTAQVHAISSIMDLFRQVQEDSDRLADDLFACYDHLNRVFAAVTEVAQCKTVEEGVLVISRHLGRIAQNNTRYYLGRLPAIPGRLTDETTLPADQTHAEWPADDFLRRHRAEIESIIGRNEDCAVATVAYRGDEVNDLEGRGNVLVLRLTVGRDDDTVGHLVFVRDDRQDLFTAVEMNLAATLGQLGSAVLGNILYAEKLTAAYLQTVMSLVRAIEAKDAYTCGHSERVAALARALGAELGLPEQQLQWLEWAGLLHDVGKIGINDAIIRKPGRLTDEEFAEIKSHPTKSYQVIAPVEPLSPVFDAVKHHHERFNGSGYPDGLTGENIPLSARILQVADVWDALTSSRSYRQALSTEKALAIMTNEAGQVSDPAIFAAFQRMVVENRLPVAVETPAVPA